MTLLAVIVAVALSLLLTAGADGLTHGGLDWKGRAVVFAACMAATFPVMWAGLWLWERFL